MLEMRSYCENCGKSLPNYSNKAMICTYECTYCIDCVETILENVCPNCGGGFEKRPTRPKGQLRKFPVSQKEIINPVDAASFEKIKAQYKSIDPRKR